MDKNLSGFLFLIMSVLVFPGSTLFQNFSIFTTRLYLFFDDK